MSATMNWFFKKSFIKIMLHYNVSFMKFFFKLTLQKNNWAAFEGLDKEENWKTDSICDTQFTILENL